jgi:predicted nuclease with TOPRIM domain
LNEKKLDRKNEKIKSLEKSQSQLKEKGNLFRSQIEDLKNELGKYIENVDDFVSPQMKEEPYNVRVAPCRMVKVIKGGASNNTSLIIFKLKSI